VNVKRYAISDLPMDDEGIAHWLRQRYVEKDLFLGQLRDQWTNGLDIEVREEAWGS
jgi:lysophosphatidic acid acyltransferase/lysophosphatidylinositol acyltransferase